MWAASEEGEEVKAARAVIEKMLEESSGSERAEDWVARKDDLQRKLLLRSNRTDTRG